MALGNNLLTNVEIKVSSIVSSNGVASKNALPTFHYIRTPPTAVASEALLEALFQSDVVVPLFAALNNRITQSNNTVRFMNDPTRVAYTAPHAAVGQVAGDSMPTANMACILYRTALRGKSFRGAHRFFPISEADTTSPNADILNAASIALWGAFVTAFLTPLVDSNGNTYTPAVYSRVLSKPTLLPQAVITMTPILTGLINKTVRESKKRKQASKF
jgi:hypothetical protein